MSKEKRYTSRQLTKNELRDEVLKEIRIRERKELELKYKMSLLQWLCT